MRFITAPLLPAAVVYWIVSGVHRWLRRLRRRRLPLPSVAVGNLTVGGTGKTPIAGWFADRFLERDRVPGVLVRRYRGDDEEMLHRVLCPDAVVASAVDRLEAARDVARRGATVLVLDDAFQRTDLEVDANVLLVDAEEASALRRWLLPAGPWRERLTAMRRADLVIVTARSSSRAGRRALEVVKRFSENVPTAMALLVPERLKRLNRDIEVAPEELVGKKVFAMAGIARPEPFLDWLETIAEEVRYMWLPDHARYGDRQVQVAVHKARSSDYVVVTKKDAVKLEGRWPADATPVLVAELSIGWPVGKHHVEEVVGRLSA